MQDILILSSGGLNCQPKVIQCSFLVTQGSKQCLFPLHPVLQFLATVS